MGACTFLVVDKGFVLVELVDIHMATADILDKQTHVGHRLDEVDTLHKVALAQNNLGQEHSANAEDSAHACRAEGCYIEELCSWRVHLAEEHCFVLEHILPMSLDNIEGFGEVDLDNS